MSEDTRAEREPNFPLDFRNELDHARAAAAGVFLAALGYVGTSSPDTVGTSSPDTLEEGLLRIIADLEDRLDRLIETANEAMKAKT